MSFDQRFLLGVMAVTSSMRKLVAMGGSTLEGRSSTLFGGEIKEP
jgi:hypothetical protein